MASDATLALLLDRHHLATNTAPPFSPYGVGYEMVLASNHNGGMLANIV